MATHVQEFVRESNFLILVKFDSTYINRIFDRSV